MVDNVICYATCLLKKLNTDDTDYTDFYSEVGLKWGIVNFIKGDF